MSKLSGGIESHYLTTHWSEEVSHLQGGCVVLAIVDRLRWKLGKAGGGRMHPTGAWLTVDSASFPNSATPGHKHLWSQEKRQVCEWRWVETQLFLPLFVGLRAHGFLGQLLPASTSRIYLSYWICTKVAESHMEVPICRRIWDDRTGSCSQHLKVAFCCWLLPVFLFLQEVVNHTHKESADFGLSISGINKGSGEVNVRPQKVSGTHELNTEWGISLFFLKMKNFECYICQTGRVICDDQSLARGWTGNRWAEDETLRSWTRSPFWMGGFEWVAPSPRGSVSHL